MGFGAIGKGLVLVLLGVTLSTAAGCFGGSRNFSPVADASTKPAAAAANPSSGTGKADVGPKIGNIAPDFTLKDLSGNTVRLNDLRGKPVLVNFWASWCPPCKEEMPDLQKAYEKYEDQGIVFLGLDLQEDADTVRKFTQQNGYSWTFLLDSDSRAAKSYLVTGVPETYFIDRDGIVRESHIGAISPAQLESKLAKIK